MPPPAKLILNGDLPRINNLYKNFVVKNFVYDCIENIPVFHVLSNSEVISLIPASKSVCGSKLKIFFNFSMFGLKKAVSPVLESRISIEICLFKIWF